MSFYKHLTPEEAAEKAVGFLTRGLPIPGELNDVLVDIGIAKYFTDDEHEDIELTPEEQRLADMGLEP